MSARSSSEKGALRAAVLALGLAAVFLAPACGTKHPVAVSLATLAAHQESYQGREVETRGTVRRFTDPMGSYFVIEDIGQNRVEILPAFRVSSFLGRLVEVRGRFRFNQRIGRFIQVEHLSAGGG